MEELLLSVTECMNGVNEVRQPEMHTAESLMPACSSLEV